jgi:hypothetical protein
MASRSGNTTTRSRSATTRVTTDHEEIRRWAEERGAQPARVAGTSILRFDFPGYSGEDTVEHISWEEFFEIFDSNNLALLYQEETSRGQRSNFNKLIDRGSAEATQSRSRSGKSEARGRTVRARNQRPSRSAQGAGGRRSSRSSKSRRTTSGRSRRSRRTSGGSTKKASRSARTRSGSRRGGKRAA